MTILLFFCVFKAGITKAPPCIIEYRSYKHYNKQSFLQDLKYVNWSTLVDVNDVDNSVNSWCKCFTDLADTHAPIKKTKVRGISIPWMTAELSRAMQDRDYHLKKAQKTQSQHHWSSYRKLRCLVNKEVRECKSKYYESLIRGNRNNPSGLWKTLNELTSCNTHSTAPSCIVSNNGVETTNSQSISTLFNTFFTGIGNTLADAIKQRLPTNIFANNQIPQFNSTFEFKEINIKSVFKQLSNLKTNKSTGLDGISAKLLKDTAAIIAPTLTDIFNQSLKLSVFPKIWKE